MANISWFRWFSFGICLGLLSHAQAATINVPADFPTIQTAIDDVGTVAGDEIVVAPGTYLLTATIDFKGKAITLRSASGDPNDTILDGQGNISHIVQCINGEDPNTVLSGFTITGGYSYGLAEQDFTGGGMYNSDSSPTVRKCIFRGNSADYAGGGMYNYLGSPTIEECIFNTNWASEGSGMYNNESDAMIISSSFVMNESFGGGGMSNTNCSPIVKDCTFTGNSADSGGGGMSNINSNTTVMNCTFSNNIADGHYGGGGMDNFNSDLIITSCSFENNSADKNGGGMYNEYSNLTITDCMFRGNYSSRDGGGMYNFLGDTNVTHCTFEGNSANEFGGGMYNYGNLIVTNCTFRGNKALDDLYSSGGGIYNTNSGSLIENCHFSENAVWGSVFESGGGGIYFDMYTGGNPTVNRCTFHGNFADNGGGGVYIYVHNADVNPAISNSVFSGNSVNDSGGGIFITGGTLTVGNCTFSGNSAVDSGGGILNTSNGLLISNNIFWGNDPDQVKFGFPFIIFSNFQGGLPFGSFDGGGNIDTDPLFVRDPYDGGDGWIDILGNAFDESSNNDYGDLRFQAGSPCIDAGDTGAVAADVADLDGDGDTAEAVPFDLAGRIRVVDELNTIDTGAGGVPVVDMGAFEYQCAGNLDSVGDVRYSDFALLQGWWLESECGFCGGADFDGDEEVGLGDLMVQMEHWLCGI